MTPKKCPFCGNVGLYFNEYGSTYRWASASCAGCGASTGEVRKVEGWQDNAVAEWNQRAPTDDCERAEVLLKALTAISDEFLLDIGPGDPDVALRPELLVEARRAIAAANPKPRPVAQPSNEHSQLSVNSGTEMARPDGQETAPSSPPAVPLPREPL